MLRAMVESEVPEPEVGLPDEVVALMDAARAERDGRVEALGRLVAKRRDEAVAARKSSGIEEIWDQDDEYYEGVDDANRGLVSWVKPAGMTGGLSRDAQRNQDAQRCTAFFNKTRQFVDAASARMGDILLPMGDWNFTVRSTPKPTLASDLRRAYPDGVPLELQAQVEQQAHALVARAETQIRDWLVEGRDHRECRLVMEYAARLGTGVIKGPVPSVRKSRVVVGGELAIVEEITPVSKCVSPRNFYPDPSCGDDIHRGNYVVERDDITVKKLRELKALPGYDAEAIDKVLEEGPQKRLVKEQGSALKQVRVKDDDLYEIWYFYGDVPVADLEAMSVPGLGEKAGGRTMPACVVLVNETPVKAFLNPLQSGEFPYDVFCWQRRVGHWAGIGVARQCRVAQDMLNAAARTLMDNAGISCAPIIVFRDGMVEAVDGNMAIGGRKVYRVVTQYGDNRGLNDIFHAVDIPTRQPELAAIIQLADKMFEEATGMFYLLQGQQGSAPDTVGGMELLHKNASATLRRIAKVFDENVTEPRMRRYYEWLLLHGPDDAKGDLQVEAIGSTVLVEREIQAMQSLQLLQMSVNPAFGLDPDKAMTEVLISMRQRPEKWKMDEAKKQQLAQSQPVDPSIEAARIAAEAKVKVAELSAQVTAVKTQADTDRDVQYTNALSRRDQIMAAQRRDEMLVKRELALLNYATKQQISLEQAKAQLANTAIKTRAQIRLAREGARARQMGSPPTEPSGRAATGRSYEQ